MHGRLVDAAAEDLSAEILDQRQVDAVLQLGERVVGQPCHVAVRRCQSLVQLHLGPLSQPRLNRRRRTRLPSGASSSAMYMAASAWNARAACERRLASAI